MKPRRSIQQGFAVIAAIFLVVVLAALGGFMLTFSNTQQLTSAQDVQGSRAYWAARAGLEWAIVAVPLAPATLCPNTTSTVIAAGVGPGPVDGFTLQISCSNNTYTEGGTSPTIYRFESWAFTAGSVGSVGYIERSLSVSLEK